MEVAALYAGADQIFWDKPAAVSSSLTSRLRLHMHVHALFDFYSSVLLC